MNDAHGEAPQLEPAGASPPASDDKRFREAVSALAAAASKISRCSEEERQALADDLQQLRDMEAKLNRGRVDIAVFGEISTGKSALVNALVGRAVTEVDVRGGWTKEAWNIEWDACGYTLPGFADSQVTLIDTPGLNEVGGAVRGDLARQVAARADLVLFVTDSDLNEAEHAALVELAAVQKPLLVVLNKIDLYSPEERERLLDVIRHKRLAHLVEPDAVVTAAADPRPREYILQSADGREESQWRKPEPDVTAVKLAILEMLERDGLAMIALNAALYASDKTDRIGAMRVRLRERHAQAIIWRYALAKGIIVAANPVPGLDVSGGGTADAAMIFHLARVYGMELTWENALGLAVSIGKSAGLVLGGELTGHLIAWAGKTLSFGYATPLTALVQGPIAAFSSYVVGQASRYYFEQGASWGSEGPKRAVTRILNSIDRESVLHRFKEEIRRRLRTNPHAKRDAEKITEQP